MLNWIYNLLRRDTDDSMFEEDAERVEPGTRESKPLHLRRWEGADTHRLNAAQYEYVTGSSINEDLVANIESLMRRCQHEATTNPMIEGMIETHAIDVVGPEGPTWRVLPRQPYMLKGNKTLQKQFSEYTLRAEETLQDWFASPDLNQQLSGTEILQMDINQQWTCGNSFVEVVDDESVGRKGIQTRWNPVHAERVLHSYLSVLNGGNHVVLGVERTKSGKVIRYWVQEPGEYGTFSSSYEFNPVPAGAMIHNFRIREPGQIVGVPFLASSLPTIGDLRQFDKLVMEAAKLAANLGIVFEDKFENADPSNPRKRSGAGAYSVKMGMASILNAPKGKTATQIDPKHPGERYKEFRGERWRDVGRAVNMPLMLVRLGSEEHNYSSARFDGQIYHRGVRVTQARVKRKYAPSMMDVLREAELAGLIPMRPIPVEIGASFARMPHVDPAKEAKARQIDLQTMTTTLIDVWAEDGNRPSEQVAKMRQTVEMLDEVQEGLGEAYLVNLLQNAGGELIAKAEDDVSGGDSKSKKTETVA